jgi:glycosyltransferase involved in cell wall biosynthesis
VSEVSVVVPSLNEGGWLKETLADLERTLPASAEVIVIDDGSTDGSVDAAAEAFEAVRFLRGPSRGVAAARNHGAAAAIGRVLVFLDAHVRLPDGWLPPLLEVIACPGAGAVAPAIEVLGRPDLRGYGLHFANPALAVTWLPRTRPEPHRVPILPGAALVMRRDLFERTGGFDTGLERWGSVDAELSLRLWLAGLDLVVHPGIAVRHRFRSRHPYSVLASDELHNRLRLATLHFAEKRLKAALAAMGPEAGFVDALTRLLSGDAAARRARLAACRVRTDDWFFKTFGDIC